MNFDITLVPHCGEVMQDGVRVVVEFDQYMIFVSGAEGSEDAFVSVRGRERELIGFVGKQPGAGINFLRVILAFGDGVASMFTQMVRMALLRAAKDRIKEAMLAVDEAKAIADEVNQFTGTDDDVVHAKQLADITVQAAMNEVGVAESLAMVEESTDRATGAPDPRVVRAILAETQGENTSSTPTENTVGDLANQQNL